ncbi:MAG: bifunctional oligoribonuclease/PAP phosphatase NrnA [Spirochaetales bacterium]|nr:bifunctional oligoribonuclease/PAP phosphatase NrnA [Spirochaetales bacterium]
MNAVELRPPQSILDFINSHENFFILGHNEPDGDCLGSQLGVSILLEKLGKTTTLLSPGPFRRPEIQEYEPLFSERIAEAALSEARKGNKSGVLIMDCSTMERIGEGLKEDITGLPIGVIDHHASGENFGEVRWILPKAPAVTLMVYSLYKAMAIELDKREAEHLFLGLSTDTGYFRHLDETAQGAFSMADSLVKAGVSPKKIFQKMNGNRTLESRVLLGKLLARTESHLENQILVTWETLDEKKSFGPENRDSDILYRQLQSIKNSEVIILVREESEGSRSVGLRSRDKVDVGAIAASKGGGGHPRAAGFNTEKPLQEIIAELIEIVTKKITGPII